MMGIRFILRPTIQFRTNLVQKLIIGAVYAPVRVFFGTAGTRAGIGRNAGMFAACAPVSARFGSGGRRGFRGVCQNRF
jgi:hypothetical protein